MHVFIWKDSMMYDWAYKLLHILFPSLSLAQDCSNANASCKTVSVYVGGVDSALTILLNSWGGSLDVIHTISHAIVCMH